MTASRAVRGIVALASLDVRREPSHRAELVTQLLLGEVVELSGRERDGWRRLRSTTDGYRGWSRTWGFVPTDAAGARRWLRRATATVTVLETRVTARPGSGLGVGPMPWQSRVIAGPARGGFRPVEWPDGRRGWAPAPALQTGRRARPDLIGRGLQLLGTPYLWGGRTPAGLDCSALVQLLLAEQGIRVPRDAHEQHRAARRLATGEAPREGDLAFFRRPGERVSHVGLCAGGSLYLHARGWVRLASVERSNPLYDMALAPQFVGWFRPRSNAQEPPFGR